MGDDDAGELLALGRDGLRAYVVELAVSVRPVSVERKVETQFVDADWSLVSYLDVEDESGDVIDVKVGGRHIAQTRADRDLQATTYLLARAVEGRPGRRFVFHSVRRGEIRTGPRCLAVGTERSESQLWALEERIAHTARLIVQHAETGDWRYASPEAWWCGSPCPHFAGCPAGGLGAELRPA